MNRRQLLRLSGAAIGGGATVAVGSRLAADRTTAQTALSLSIDGDSAELAADETVAALWLAVDVEWAYDLPDDRSPESVLIELFAAREDDERELVADAQQAQLFVEADGSESFDVDLVGDGPLSADGVTPDAGESAETTVEITARMSVTGGDELLARESSSDTATVTVEQAASAEDYGSVGGSGSLSIEIGTA